MIQVRIKDNTNNVWYNRDTNVFDIADGSEGTAWYAAVTTNSWTNWYSTVTLTTDNRYWVNARAFDAASNESANFSTATFIMDQDIPVSAVTFPANSAYVVNITTSVNPIYGTYGDTGVTNVGSVSQVQVAIRQLGPPSVDKWYNGAGAFTLGTPPTSNTASLWSSSWTYVGLSTANLTSGTSYYITTKALDNASPANSEGFYTVGEATFTYDGTAPTVVVQAPVNASFFNNTSALTISGTAVDTLSGLNTVQVNINDGGGNYWSGTHNGAGSFGAGVNYVTADLTNDPTWQFTIPTGELTADFVQGTTYYISARASDVAGSTSAFTAVRTITYDVLAPTAAVTVPGSYMNASQTEITGTATDAPAGIQKIEIALSSRLRG